MSRTRNFAIGTFVGDTEQLVRKIGIGIMGNDEMVFCR